jgi:glycosyltransferase involved in cell wall biosynthesis
MSIRRVVVCAAQVPFVQGGAESLVSELVQQFRARGFEAELVSLPFKWYPREEILAHAASWRLLDLSESNHRPIDLAVGTKFPSYFVRHPHKVLWLMHQYRAAYELCGTEYSDFTHVEQDVGLRERLIRLDREMIGECERAFSISRRTSERLRHYNGIDLPPLYHPPRLASRLYGAGSEGYVLSAGRLDRTKRVDLVIRAMTYVDPGVRLRIVGDGNERKPLEGLAAELKMSDRVAFLGTVTDAEIVEQYAKALATVFVPYDEDLGYVTLESFLARKPVVTAKDSGGPLEFVEHGLNGLACDPTPEAIAEAINRLAADPSRAAAMGDEGYDRARRITWDGVVESLVGSTPAHKTALPAS